MEDSDSEYEIEEAVVLVELNGIIDSNFLMKEQETCRILGIESDKPIFQLGNYTFCGEYEDTLGTVVVYEPDESQKDEENAEPKYKFLCKTDKKLSMKRIFIQEKREDNARSVEFVAESNTSSNSLKRSEESSPLKEIKENSTKKQRRKKLKKETRNLIPSLGILPDSNVERLNLDERNHVANNREEQAIKEGVSRTETLSSSDVSDVVSEIVNKTVLVSDTLDKSHNLEIDEKEKSNEKDEMKFLVKSIKLETSSKNNIPSQEAQSEIKLENLTEQVKEEIISDEQTAAENIMLTKNLHSFDIRSISDASIPDVVNEIIDRTASVLDTHDFKSENLSPQNLEQDEDTKNKYNKKAERKKRKCDDEEDIRFGNIANKKKLKEAESGIIPSKKEENSEKMFSELSNLTDEADQNPMEISESDENETINSTAFPSSAEAHAIEPFNSALNENDQDEKISHENVKPQPFGDPSDSIDMIDNVTQENSSSVEFDTVNPHSLTLATPNIVETQPSKSSSLAAEVLYSDSEKTLENQELEISDNPQQKVESSTDKSNNVVQSNDSKSKNGCSSSGDASKVQNKQVYLCQSSDHNTTLENVQSDDHLSFNQNEKNLVSQSSDECITHQTELLSEEIKGTVCEVSQSSKDETSNVLQSELPLNESNECEAQQSSNHLVSELEQNESFHPLPEEILNPNEYFDGQVSEIDLSVTRKLSSCEVTQSCSSNIDSKQENTGECDVFLQNNVSGAESFSNPSSSMRDPLTSADESLCEVNLIRHSVNSEGSTSEITQSHRAESYFSADVIEQIEGGVCDTNVGLCSQSTCVSVTVQSAESKDSCVSSCDCDQRTSVSLERGLKHMACEVSQSDKCGDGRAIEAQNNDVSCENNLNEISASEGQDSCSNAVKNSDEENFCEVTESYEPSEVVPFENNDFLAENTSECEPLLSSDDIENSVEISTVDGVQLAPANYIKTDGNISCEVSQSFSSEKISTAVVDLNSNNKLHSSECEVYEPNYLSEDSELVPANDSNLVSSEILVIPEEEECINPSCEVSQSFRSAEESNLPFEECCVSSDDGNSFPAHYSVIEDEGQTTEVSQSLIIPVLSEIKSYKEGEYSQSDLHSHSSEPSTENPNESAGSSKEVCSSDEIITISASDDTNPETSVTNNATCEVTQSDRCGENDSVSLAHDIFEDEAVNECETTGKLSDTSNEPKMSITIDDNLPKNICESSDDVDSATSERLDLLDEQLETNVISSDVCQSSKCDENLSRIDEAKGYDNVLSSESNSQPIMEIDFIDTNRNICESSEDVQIIRTSDPCTSSNRTENEISLSSSFRLCDSISNQDAADEFKSSEMESNVSHSEENAVVNQNLIISPQPTSLSRNSITVSSSVDISSNSIGVIYSSRISHLPVDGLSSNYEISQSTMRTRLQDLEGSEAFNQQNEGNNCSDNANHNQQSVIVSSEVNVTSYDLGNEDTKFETADNTSSQTSNIVISFIQRGDKSTSIESSSSCSRVESSGLDILREFDIEPKAYSNKDEKKVKEIVPIKRFGRRMKFTPKIVCKVKGEEMKSGPSCKESKIDTQSSTQHAELSASDSIPESVVILDSDLNETKSNSDSKPSLLEVIVSSASDFRNSLVHDTSGLEKDADKVASPSGIAESSSNNESRESFSIEGGQSSEEQPNSEFYPLRRNPFQNMHVDFVDLSHYRCDDDDSSQQQVSQSTDIKQFYTIDRSLEYLDRAREAAFRERLQNVQSTSGMIRAATDNSSIDFNNSFDEFDVSVPNTSESMVVSLSSRAVFTSPSVGNNTTFSGESFAQCLGSSNNTIIIRTSPFAMDNTENNVTSTPFGTIISNSATYSVDGSGQCSLIEGTDETYQSSSHTVNIISAAPADIDFEINPNLNSTSDNKVTASNNNDSLPSESWNSNIDEENICASSSIDVKDNPGDYTLTKSLMINSEMSNEAEVLQSTSAVSRSNLQFVRENNVTMSEAVSQAADIPSESNTEDSFVVEISQSSDTDQNLQSEMYSESSEITLFPEQNKSISRAEIITETTKYISNITEELESPGNSVVPSESLPQNIILISGDSSIYSQPEELIDHDSIHSSSHEVAHFSMNEQEVAPSTSSMNSDSIQSLTQTVPLMPIETFDERSNVSQSDIEEPLSQSVPFSDTEENTETHDINEVDRLVSSNDSCNSDQSSEKN